MTPAELKQHCINTINKKYLSDRIREEHALMLKIIEEWEGLWKRIEEKPEDKEQRMSEGKKITKEELTRAYEIWESWKARNSLIKRLQESPWGLTDTLNMLAFAAEQLIKSDYDYDGDGNEKIKACLNNYKECKESA